MSSITFPFQLSLYLTSFTIIPKRYCNTRIARSVQSWERIVRSRKTGSLDNYNVDDVCDLLDLDLPKITTFGSFISSAGIIALFLIQPIRSKTRTIKM
jgi:hypothetical protein